MFVLLAFKNPPAFHPTSPTSFQANKFSQRRTTTARRRRAKLPTSCPAGRELLKQRYFSSLIHFENFKTCRFCCYRLLSMNANICIVSLSLSLSISSSSFLVLHYSLALYFVPKSFSQNKCIAQHSEQLSVGYLTDKLTVFVLVVIICIGVSKSNANFLTNSHNMYCSYPTC